MNDVSTADLIEIIRFQHDVIEALTDHVAHDAECPGDAGCTCGLGEILSIARTSAGPALVVH